MKKGRYSLKGDSIKFSVGEPEAPLAETDYDGTILDSEAMKLNWCGRSGHHSRRHNLPFRRTGHNGQIAVTTGLARIIRSRIDAHRAPPTQHE